MGLRLGERGANTRLVERQMTLTQKQKPELHADRGERWDRAQV